MQWTRCFVRRLCLFTSFFPFRVFREEVHRKRSALGRNLHERNRLLECRDSHLWTFLQKAPHKFFASLFIRYHNKLEDWAALGCRSALKIWSAPNRGHGNNNLHKDDAMAAVWADEPGDGQGTDLRIRILLLEDVEHYESQRWMIDVEWVFVHVVQLRLGLIII